MSLFIRSSRSFTGRSMSLSYLPIAINSPGLMIIGPACMLAGRHTMTALSFQSIMMQPPQPDVHQIFQIVHRTFNIIGNRHATVLLEIKQAGILPDLCVPVLAPEFPLHPGKALCIHIGFCPVPYFLEITNFEQAILIMPAKFIP